MTDPGRRTLLLAAVLAAGQLAVLGPLAVWADNRDSFAGLSGAALLTLGAALLGLVLLFVLPGLLVPRAARPLGAALCGLTLLMWGQSFLSSRLLTGTQIAGAASSAQQVGELLVWVILLGTALALSARLLQPLSRAALFVVVIQVLALGWTVASAAPRTFEAAAEQERAFDRLAGLSSSRNIIVLVLDGLHRDFATQALSENPELAASFAGFRVFTDHLATFPTTRFSIPAMLSGRNYDNLAPAEAFIENAIAGDDSAPLLLQNEGWDVGVATTIRPILDIPVATRVAVQAHLRQRTSAQALGLELLDLSAFRHAPARLGTWVYNADRWRLRQFAAATRENYHAMGSRNFITDYVARVRVTTSTPVFRFIHIGGAHPPLIVDSACSFIGVQEYSAAAYAEQVECALSQAAELLDRLRALDILDQTAFIVVSDHGVDITGLEEPLTWAIELAAATLMIKPVGADGAPVFDSLPTSNQDLPAIVGLLATEGASASLYLPSRIVPERGRSFFFHSWQNNDWNKPYLTALHAFEVGPGAAQKSAWSYVGTTPSPEGSAREQARLRKDGAALFSPQAP